MQIIYSRFKSFILKALALFVLLLIFLLLVNVILLEQSSHKKAQNFMRELSNEFDESLDIETIVARLGGNASEIDELKKSDKRVALVKLVFRKYDSVLYDYAEFIVKTSDSVGIDYRIIPSIAMQESTGCKRIPPNSYNCWGYGIYGNKVTRFSSYEEAITTVAKGLKKNYIDKGLTTPEAIMKKYTPPSDGSWAKSVNFFLGKF